MARVGYSLDPNEGEIFVVGWQYAVLRRSFPELSGTAVEHERTAILLWFTLFFIGITIGISGLAMQVAEP
jgi:hypothetical protein